MCQCSVADYESDEGGDGSHGETVESDGELNCQVTVALLLTHNSVHTHTHTHETYGNCYKGDQWVELPVGGL